MIAYYLSKGHSLKSLYNMDENEEKILYAAMLFMQEQENKKYE